MQKKFDINKIAEKIESHGGRLYLVGGAVRDLILNEENHDEDYCVVGLDELEFEKIFKDAYPRGKKFRVYDICGKEFALARKEKKCGNGHTAFEITTNKNVTIIDDLKRRDLTINSIAQDVLTKEIIDPFGGINDLKNKIIKATSEAFKEDPLRVYRVARFAAKLQFEVDRNTLKQMEGIKTELESLSEERVFEEFRKAINTKKPSTFFEVLKKANVLDVHFKEIFKLIGVEQPEKYHPEGDSYNHTMLALDMSAKLTKDEKIRFSCLVHDLGKGLTPKEEYPHHIGHEEKGIGEVEKFAKRLKMPNSWRKCGKTAAKYHMKGGIFDRMKPNKKVSFIENVYKTELGLYGLEIVVDCDRNCRGDKKEKVEFANIGTECIKKINGKYIQEKYNIKPGKELKNKLHQERVEYFKYNNI